MMLDNEDSVVLAWEKNRSMEQNRGTRNEPTPIYNKGDSVVQ